MEIKENRIQRKYGEFIFKDIKYNKKEQEKERIRRMEIYRWKDGRLSIIIDNQSTFVIKEKELIEGIKKIPKTN